MDASGARVRDRLVDALEGNSRRIFDCRVFGSADAAQLVTRFVSAKWAACGSPDRECTRRPDHRDDLVRVFRGKHSARQFALVARHQFRRRDFVYLRRPDRHSDHIIYAKYYGVRAAAWITGIFYLSMVLAEIVVDVVFSVLGLIPQGVRSPSAVEHAHIIWNYTGWLDVG